MFGGDCGEDFEDVGGLLDDVGAVCGEEFGDFFAQLVAQGSAVIVRSLTSSHGACDPKPG